MKRTPSLVLLCSTMSILAIIIPASAQVLQDINFDDSALGDVHIDTTDGHGGLWQIGPPQKTHFTSAYSSPNVIVTGTTLSYPPNDTSRFTVNRLAEGGWLSGCCVVGIMRYYQVGADSLHDFGTIEVSYNPDSAWIDVLHDSLFAPMIWAGNAPTLTGRSNGWSYFVGNLGNVAGYLQSQGYQAVWGDTLRWRFSFISDSVGEQMDGLMYDNLHFEDWAESVPEYTGNTFHSSVAGNPVSNTLGLIYETVGLGQLVLSIFDARGTLVRQQQLRAEHRSRIDVHQLRAGLYMYSLDDYKAQERSMGRFVKE
ncbi:MAG TPA: T9SS type A sorting domain-containing protein [Flavobacteriales bacterium]|nr:T9SS type A sorting domain-containing protein [Flavobacteriales bacterium]